jgi:hypothetical protein
MNSDTKNLYDILILAGGLCFTALSFVMTLWINGRNRRVENGLKSLGVVMNKEADLRIEAKRIARDRMIPFWALVDKILEGLKTLGEEHDSAMDDLIRVEFRKAFFDIQTFLPNEMINAITNFISACISATADRAHISRYFDKLEIVREKYFELLGLFRKTYYFEATDMSSFVESEISKMRPADSKP